MVMVDDATNRVWAQFFEEETTRASYDVLAGWADKYGLPQSLYVDRDMLSTGAKGWAASPNRSRGPGTAKPSLGGRCGNWAWS